MHWIELEHRIFLFLQTFKFPRFLQKNIASDFADIWQYGDSRPYCNSSTHWEKYVESHDAKTVDLSDSNSYTYDSYLVIYVARVT